MKILAKDWLKEFFACTLQSFENSATSVDIEIEPKLITKILRIVYSDIRM